LLKSNAYTEYFKYIDLSSLRDESRELWYLYNTLQSLRNEFPQLDLDAEDLHLAFWAAYPDASHDLYDGLFTDLRSADPGEDVGRYALEQIKRRKSLLELSEAAYKASQGLTDLQPVTSLAESLKSSPQAEELSSDCFISTDLEELVNEVVAKPGIRWRLGCLNKSLGSIRPGDFGFVFARPETGKTTFLADVASGSLEQVTQPVVWFNNEEQDNKVMLRIFQSYFGVPLDRLMANQKEYNRVFNEQVGGKLRLINSSKVDINKETVERILESVKPSLIIYDQIDKIKGFKADRDDLLLGAIYQWARELAKKYAPTIAVCQADGTGEGQKWLTMANVANAKTSKQAEADFIIGIGKTHDAATENVRYLNLSKNKLMGDADSEPALRHGRFEVVIQPEIARYKDIVEY